MGTSQQSAVAATGLSLVALAVAVTALVRDTRPASPPPSTPEMLMTRGDLEDLESRLASLESRPQQSTTRPPAGSSTPAPTSTRRPVESSVSGTNDAQFSRMIEELNIRVANLEKASERAADQKRSLAQPDSIPAALAVLLASRGIVTKVGDIEAIQANLDELAALSADTTRDDWDRIEAYRGMLMFGYDHPDKCEAAEPGIAAILLSSRDPKARRSAAAMLSSSSNPLVTNTMLAAFSQDADSEVRAALANVLLNRRADPIVLNALRRAAKTEPDDALRARLIKALEQDR